MKAILSKEGGGYDLYRIDEDGKRVTFASTQDYKQKLSLKNCEAIANGYDLDELAEDYLTLFPEKTSDPDRNFVRMGMEEGFKDGFQKALEILGDKKFSEEDINNAMNWIMTQYFEFYEQPTAGRREHYIQSLQQTEWDCIVEMEEVDVQFDRSATSLTDYDHFTVTRKPKLDADGCIVLKRK